MRTRAERRHHYARALRKAKQLMKLLHMPEQFAVYWAENRRKCSCHLCRRERSRDDRHKIFATDL